MNNTAQFQSTDDTKIEMELLIVEWARCSYIGAHYLTMFLIGGIGVTLVSLIGIIGNTLCAIVLSRPPMRTSTNIILFGLSVYDLTYVFMALLIYGIPWSIRYFCVDSFESLYWNTLYPIIVIYLSPFALIGQLGSTYFTLLVTMERCFVVYRPLMARPYCTNKNAIRVSLATVAFTVLSTMPLWWEFKIESVYDEDGSWTKYRLLPLLRHNEYYLLYYDTWVCMFVFRIIPITLLTLLNIFIYLKIREANKMRESMTQVTSTEISVAKMLIWVVSIFLLCNLFELYMYLRDVVGAQYSLELLAPAIFFFSLNSSVNFIIYSFKTNTFKLVFLELFGLNKQRGRSCNNVLQNAEAEERTTGTQLRPTHSTTNA